MFKYMYKYIYLYKLYLYNLYKNDKINFFKSLLVSKRSRLLYNICRYDFNYLQINFIIRTVHSIDIDSRGTCMVYFKIMQSHWIIQV